MTRFHIPMKHHNVNLRKGNNPVPPVQHTPSPFPANTPVGIISPPPVLVSEGGNIRKNYAKIIENHSHHDPMSIKNSDILSKISFGKKNTAKHDNIKFVF